MDTVRLTIEIPANVASSLAEFLAGLKVQVESKNVSSYVGDVVVELPQSAEEVVKYCEDNGLIANGTKFYNFYKDRGWRTTSGKPVDDWKKLLLKWDDGDRANAKTKMPLTPRVTHEDDTMRLANKLGVDYE